MASVRCPSCSMDVNLSDSSVGERVKCPACGTLFAATTLAATPISAPVGGSRTILDPFPESFDAGDAPTSPGKLDATIDQQFSTDETQLSDFLAPPQDAEELGRLGQYRMLEILGKGGMGVVFRAEDLGLRRVIAVKTMIPALASNPKARERFLREARAAAAIEHEHIVTIYQVGVERGLPFLAMPLLKGQPLDEALEDPNTMMSIAEIVRIGKEIAEGLAAAHAVGMIHRDVKPANIWLEGERRKVKVLDFGLARYADDSTHLTTSGAVVGTPAYMAPEQARGEKVDGRADLFSLGAILYQMSTGCRPFSGTNTMSILSSLALDTPVSPRQRNALVPPAVSDIVMRLLAKNPDDRFATAREAAEALGALEQQCLASAADNLRLPIPPPETALPSATRPAGRRSSRWTVAAILLTTAVVGFSAYWLAPRKVGVEGEPPTKGAEVATAKGEPPTQSEADDPERAFASWVMSVGGTVEVYRGLDSVGPFDAATRGPISVASITLNAKKSLSVDQAMLEKHLSALSDRGRIARLDLEMPVDDTFVSRLAAWRGTRNLSEVVFRKSAITDAAMRSLRRLEKLTTIEIFDATLSADGLSELRDLPLKRLVLGTCGLRDADLAALKDSPVENLQLPNNRITETGLANLGNPPNLAVLGLKVTDVGTRLGELKRFPKLRELLLQNAHVTDAGLAGAPTLPSLDTLEFDAAPISEVGLKHIGACKGLVRLGFAHMRIGDDDLSCFADLSKLARLTLQETDVTPAGVAAFQAKLPNCKIEWEGIAAP
jgi:eukaryotic-like serine/threonine-protein kinase